MNRAVVFVPLLLAALAGCDEDRKRDREDHREQPAIRAAEVRGEAMHAIQLLNEAVHRSEPFADRMDEVREHATWLFEHGPLSLHQRYREAWFECKRVVHELVEPAKEVRRVLLEQVADLKPEGELKREEARRIRKVIHQGKGLAEELNANLYARVRGLLQRLEPALSRYPLPAHGERAGGR
jgi:protein involved in temperature-dependent protein secretion